MKDDRIEPWTVLDKNVYTRSAAKSLFAGTENNFGFLNNMKNNYWQILHSAEAFLDGTNASNTSTAREIVFISPDSPTSEAQHQRKLHVCYHYVLAYPDDALTGEKRTHVNDNNNFNLAKHS